VAAWSISTTAAHRRRGAGGARLRDLGFKRLTRELIDILTSGRASSTARCSRTACAVSPTGSSPPNTDAGGVPRPSGAQEKGPVRAAEFVFMDRPPSAGGVFLHLRAELNFYRLFNEAIEDFSITQVTERQRSRWRRGLAPEACHSRSRPAQRAPACRIDGGFGSSRRCPPANICAKPRPLGIYLFRRFRWRTTASRICDRDRNDLVEHEATYKSFVQLPMWEARFAPPSPSGSDRGTTGRWLIALPIIFIFAPIVPPRAASGRGCRAESWCDLPARPRLCRFRLKACPPRQRQVLERRGDAHSSRA